MNIYSLQSFYVIKKSSTNNHQYASDEITSGHIYGNDDKWIHLKIISNPWKGISVVLKSSLGI